MWQLCPCLGGVLSICVEGDTQPGAQSSESCCSSAGGEQDQTPQRQIALLHLLLFLFMRPRKKPFSHDLHPSGAWLVALGALHW